MDDKHLYPAGTILELGPPHFDPNAPNIKHTMTKPAYLASHYGTRPIIVHDYVTVPGPGPAVVEDFNNGRCNN